MHLDCTSLTDVNQFTHVYSFDLAFPPDTIESLVNIYNYSANLQCVVSYKYYYGLKFQCCDDCNCVSYMTGILIKILLVNY